MTYLASPDRYQDAQYNRCGKSGLLLSPLTIGLSNRENLIESKKKYLDIITHAFNHGITCFEVIQSSEQHSAPFELMIGELLNNELLPYRDELIISTKTGFNKDKNPFYKTESKKHIINEIDRKLKRLQLDYFDIVYAHQWDYETPLEESMSALSHLVKSGKAFYIGLSDFPREEIKQAATILHKMNTPCLVAQENFDPYSRWVEEYILDILNQSNMGFIANHPFNKGRLTDTFLYMIDDEFELETEKHKINDDQIQAIKTLQMLALNRSQSIEELTLSWILSLNFSASILTEITSVRQLQQYISATKKTEFTEAEKRAIEFILKTTKPALF